MNRLKKIAVVLAVVLSGTFLAATPAQAAAPLDCPNEQICFFQHADFTGYMVNYDPFYFGFGACVNLPTWFKDQTSAWISKSTFYGARLHPNDHCGGSYVDQGGPFAAHSYNWLIWGCNDCTNSWRVITGPAG